ncbi:LamG-like jellyroll fold domain-containing protein [Flaviaesturariibacter aridisoli]|uniref:T9SS type B sorting domain-containing protein n=1 Tax=Flaviaesturariibacter aridisoli TaxID=2545761 RepID=A0A4V6P690_9BACT|nr:LamG-like jellyroll fold domain-containing protein [Flaviaesturariibacter aridisoli]TCZ74422.1 T9SS type B sorting domain-containing protein [Flaviaesturariibacter aridisoli]
MRTLLSLFLLTVVSFFASAQVNLNQGLVANYPFNGTANDATGNGHNAAVQGGAVFSTDRFGNVSSAMSFDGIDDYLRIVDNGAFSTTSFSLSFWFSTDRNNLVQVPVGKRDFGPTNNSEFGINLMPAASGSHLQTFLVSNAKPCSVFGAPNDYYVYDAFPANYCTVRWYHVVVTFSNGIQKIYLDGQLKSSSTAPFTAKSTCQTDLRFGMWWGGDPSWFRGKLDDIRWYSREINAAEALALYSSPVAPAVQANCASCLQLPQAGISGAVVCGNGTGFLTFSATAGTAPYTVTISDGSNSFTQLITTNSATIPVAAVTTTTYTLISVKDATGCERGTGFTSGSATVNFNPLPIIATTPANPSFCPGDSVQLSATGGSTYAWSPATGLSNPTIANPKAAPAATTTYKLVVTTAAGCKDSLNVTVTRKTAPTVTLTPANPAFCPGDSVQLVSGGGTTYNWVPTTGLSSASIASPKAAPLATTSYKVLVTNAQGCKDSASVTVTRHPAAVATVSATNPVFCQGDTTQLTATGGVSYAWSPSATLSNASITAPLAFPLATTSYKVVVTNNTGCRDSALIVLTVNPKPVVNLGPDTLLCGSNTLAFNATIAGATQYNWSNGSTAASTSVNAPGTYSVAVQVNGCITPARDTVVVSQATVPTVTLGADRKICSTDNLQLGFNGTNYTSFVWSTGSASPTISINTAGQYWIRVQNSCGAAADSVDVQTEICNDDLYFPSAFTPNHDGKNDGFKAIHAAGVTMAYYHLRIYNRWGNRVFQTYYLEAAWGGTIEGERQGLNTFVYYVEYRRTPNSPLINKKGTFVQIR